MALFAGGLKAHPNQSKDRCSTGRCLEKNLKRRFRFFSLKAGYILASDWHNFRQCQDPDAQEERYKVDEIGRIVKLDKFKK